MANLACCTVFVHVLCLSNQVHASLQPVRTWFLKTVSAQMFLCMCLCLCLCVHVCPPLRLLNTSGMMWHGMDPYNWLNKFYSCYMATVVIIINGHGLGIDTCQRH